MSEHDTNPNQLNLPERLGVYIEGMRESADYFFEQTPAQLTSLSGGAARQIGDAQQTGAAPEAPAEPGDQYKEVKRICSEVAAEAGAYLAEAGWNQERAAADVIKDILTALGDRTRTDYINSLDGIRISLQGIEPENLNGRRLIVLDCLPQVFQLAERQLSQSGYRPLEAIFGTGGPETESSVVVDSRSVVEDFLYAAQVTDEIGETLQLYLESGLRAAY